MPLQRRGPHGLTQQEHMKYFQDKVQPTVEDLTLDIIIEQPEELVPSMIKWLAAYTKLDLPSALDNERLSNEVSALTADIAALEAQLAEQSRAGPQTLAAESEAKEERQEKLKYKAQNAISAALLGDDYEGEFEEDRELQEIGEDEMREKAQDALQAALLGRSEEDDDALKKKARGSLRVALLGGDYEDEFEDGDDLQGQVEQERREDSEEVYLEQLKQKAQGAVSSVLLGEDFADEFEEDREEDPPDCGELQAKAQQALQAALLGDDDLREKAQSAVQAALLGDDDLREKAQDALQVGLTGDANDDKQAPLDKSVTEYSMGFDEEEFEEDFAEDEDDEDATEQSVDKQGVDSKDEQREEVERLKGRTLTEDSVPLERNKTDLDGLESGTLETDMEAIGVTDSHPFGSTTTSVNLLPPEEEQPHYGSENSSSSKPGLRRGSNLRPPSRNRTKSLEGTSQSLEGMVLASVPLDEELTSIGSARTAQTSLLTGANSLAPNQAEQVEETAQPKRRSLLPWRK